MVKSAVCASVHRPPSGMHSPVSKFPSPLSGGVLPISRALMLPFRANSCHTLVCHTGIHIHTSIQRHTHGERSGPEILHVQINFNYTNNTMASGGAGKRASKPSKNHLSSGFSCFPSEKSKPWTCVRTYARICILSQKQLKRSQGRPSICFGLHPKTNTDQGVESPARACSTPLLRRHNTLLLSDHAV